MFIETEKNRQWTLVFIETRTEKNRQWTLVFIETRTEKNRQWILVFMETRKERPLFKEKWPRSEEGGIQPAHMTSADGNLRCTSVTDRA